MTKPIPPLPSPIVVAENNRIKDVADAERRHLERIEQDAESLDRFVESLPEIITRDYRAGGGITQVPTVPNTPFPAVRDIPMFVEKLNARIADTPWRFAVDRSH